MLRNNVVSMNVLGKETIGVFIYIIIGLHSNISNIIC